jgi:hypothetical protein
MLSAPPRRPLSPAEDIAIAPVIAAAQKAGAAGVVLILRGGAEITLCFPADDEKAAPRGDIVSESDAV